MIQRSFKYIQISKIFALKLETLYNLFIELIMQKSEDKLGKIIITNIQKNIEPKQLIQYLSTNKLLEKIHKFSKSQDKIRLQFINEKEAHSFYYQNCFVSKILVKKFNIYYSFFDDKQNNKILQYELSGNLENKMRPIFEICNFISKSCFRFSMKDNKFNTNKCIVELEDISNQTQILNTLQSKLNQIQVSIRKIENEQDQNNLFKCSIQIVNFQQIKSLKIGKEELKNLEKHLQLLISKICSNPIKTVEIMTLQDQSQQKLKLKIKAFLQFSNPQLTMHLFQKIRIHFIDYNQIKVKLYYFRHQANTFMTLFTTGLQRPVNIDSKHFQDQILTSFRNINAKIVQVLVKQGYGNLCTAKIYMADQQSGKQLISNYNKNREFIFRLYKDKSKISLNLFQKLEKINEMKKIETNTQRILSNMRQAKLQEMRCTPIPLIQPPMYKPYRHTKTNFKPKHRQRQGQEYQDNNHKQSNFVVQKSFKLKEEQFPSI